MHRQMSAEKNGSFALCQRLACRCTVSHVIDSDKFQDTPDNGLTNGPPLTVNTSPYVALLPTSIRFYYMICYRTLSG